MLSRLLCLQIDMQNVNLRQLSNLTSAFKLSEPDQNDSLSSVQRVRFDFVRFRLRVRIELSCRACNSRRECGFSPRSRHRSRRRLNIFYCLTLCFIYLTKCSLYVFRTRVFSSIVIYVKLYIFKRKYTSCYPGSNIDVSTHRFSVLL